jgi:hypothetical protein
VGLELARSDHHAEVCGNCHVAPQDLGDVGVRAACLTGVASATPKSPSRLRRLSQRHSMVVRSSSPKWRRSSLAYKSTVARLAAGSCGADGTRGAVSERECATDGTGAPLGWFTC